MFLRTLRQKYVSAFKVKSHYLCEGDATLQSYAFPFIPKIGMVLKIITHKKRPPNHRRAFKRAYTIRQKYVINLSFNGKTISDSPNGFDIFRIRGIFLNFGAQVPDINHNRIIIDNRIFPDVLI